MIILIVAVGVAAVHIKFNKIHRSGDHYMAKDHHFTDMTGHQCSSHIGKTMASANSPGYGFVEKDIIVSKTTGKKELVVLCQGVKCVQDTEMMVG